MRNDIYQHKQLQERQGTPLALSASTPAKGDVADCDVTKLNAACRSGNTRYRQRGRISVHSVYVLDKDGKPLTPTTPVKARKLLKGGQAKKVWSKFNTFGIQMLVEVGNVTPDTTLGIDNGSKYEGYSVVVGNENVLSVKWDLPDKKKIVRKMRERSQARRTRRSRLRCRSERFNNRQRKGFIAPSQMMLVQSRLKAIRELCGIYPITCVAIEDVRFNHTKYRWGKNFSTVEIGKNKLREWFDKRGIKRFEYRGFETAELRKKYGYKKTRVKNADKFSSHCSDSLALAVEVNCGERVEPGEFIVVDDTYRCVRRRLHESQPKRGGIRKKYSRGAVFSIQKGRIVGTNTGKIGQLCGEKNGRFTYYDKTTGKRSVVKSLNWVNNQLKIVG